MAQAGDGGVDVGQHQADAGSDAYDKDFALSLLSQEQLVRILTTLRDHFRVADDAEITQMYSGGGKVQPVKNVSDWSAACRNDGGNVPRFHLLEWPSAAAAGGDFVRCRDPCAD